MSDPSTLSEPPNVSISSDDRLEQRLRLASAELRDCVEISPLKLGGVPVLRGTRFPIAQVLSHLADGDSVDDIAENFELDHEQLSKLLHVLFAYLDRPLSPV